MSIATTTPEGWPARCPVCGKDALVEPSLPTLDAVCPHCGALLWLARPAPGEFEKLREKLEKQVAAMIWQTLAAVALTVGVITLLWINPKSSMFGLGWMEITVLGVIGLLVFGKRSTALARALGNWLGPRHRP